MAHLLWHLPSDNRILSYPWILWYIWKFRNNDLFRDRDKDLREYVALAEAEASAWADAQQRNTLAHLIERVMSEPHTCIAYCQIDGA